MKIRLIFSVLGDSLEETIQMNGQNRLTVNPKANTLEFFVDLITQSSYQRFVLASLNVKVVSPSFDSAVSAPPCCSAIFAPIAKPRPLPG